MCGGFDLNKWNPLLLVDSVNMLSFSIYLSEYIPVFYMSLVYPLFSLSVFSSSLCLSILFPFFLSVSWLVRLGCVHLFHFHLPDTLSLLLSVSVAHLLSSVMFWDIRAQRAGVQPASDKKQKVEENPYSVPDTFSHLDLTWAPLVKVRGPLGVNTPLAQTFGMLLCCLLSHLKVRYLRAII